FHRRNKMITGITGLPNPTAYSEPSNAIYRCGLKALQTIAQVFQAGFAVQITVVSICAVSLIYLFYAAYERTRSQGTAELPSQLGSQGTADATELYLKQALFKSNIKKWLATQTHLSIEKKAAIEQKLIDCYNKRNPKLDLSNCRLRSVPDLSALTSLKQFNLSNNRIANVSDLSALTSLEELDLSNNSFDIGVINDCVTNLHPGINGLEVYFTDYYPLSKDYTVEDDGLYTSANGVHFYFARPMQSK
ncbi:MAG: leucine-rich repeat domain-containing protein, partial [Pseudomonadales bacterium]|nr:leucine-rich repeat domain-containing protein [Pseudomonadales bacterium]